MTLSPEPAENCKLCPRLYHFRQKNSQLYPDWHNAPVSSFGTDTARFLIVGLAPGLKGANRTGRSFTGDQSGQLLFATLEKYGFTDGEFGNESDDGLTLVDTMITNAVRCVPPENKPLGAEANACRRFLADSIKSMPNLSAILALGTIAHSNILRALGVKIKSTPFGHGSISNISGPDGDIKLFNSYHCSRYNINTKRLTEPMFETVFSQIRIFLDEG